MKKSGDSGDSMKNRAVLPAMPQVGLVIGIHRVELIVVVVVLAHIRSQSLCNRRGWVPLRIAKEKAREFDHHPPASVWIAAN